MQVLNLVHELLAAHPVTPLHADDVGHQQSDHGDKPQHQGEHRLELLDFLTALLLLALPLHRAQLVLHILFISRPDHGKPVFLGLKAVVVQHK